MNTVNNLQVCDQILSIGWIWTLIGSKYDLLITSNISMVWNSEWELIIIILVFSIWWIPLWGRWTFSLRLTSDVIAADISWTFKAFPDLLVSHSDQLGKRGNGEILWYLMYIWALFWIVGTVSVRSVFDPPSCLFYRVDQKAAILLICSVNVETWRITYRAYRQNKKRPKYTSERLAELLYLKWIKVKLEKY